MQKKEYHLPNLPYFETWGEGEPLLMIHAFLFSNEMYYPMLPAFMHKYKVILPDLRGYGKNKAMPGPFSIKQQAADIKGILDALHVSQTHVIGYSKGGVVAQQLAIDYPEKVKSLVLGCTFPAKPVTAFERLQRMFLTTAFKRVGARGLLRLVSHGMADAVGKMDPVTFAWYKKMVADNNPEVVIMSAYEMFKFDSRPHLHKIKCPTLVVAAGSDIVVPIHHGRTLVGSIPKAQMKVIEEAGHGLIHTHKDAFINYVRHFYDGIEKAEERRRTLVKEPQRRPALQIRDKYAGSIRKML